MKKNTNQKKGLAESPDAEKNIPRILRLQAFIKLRVERA